MRKRMAVWICVCAGVIMLSLQCGVDQGPVERLAVTPESLSLDVSSSQQFTADNDGQPIDVAWYVDGIRGGAPSTGMITTGGLYLSPAALPPGGTVELRAQGIADTTLFGTAVIEVLQSEITPYVTVSPDTISISASGSVEFASGVFGCPAEGVSWSKALIWGAPFSDGTIGSDGRYVAPSDPGASFALLIGASSEACPGKTGIARVVVYAAPREFVVELEDFTEKTDFPGSLAIKGEFCSGASGEHAVRGLDRPAESIKVPVEIPASGTYTLSLRYQANPGAIIAITVNMAGCGSSGSGIMFVLAEGQGMG